MRNCIYKPTLTGPSCDVPANCTLVICGRTNWYCAKHYDDFVRSLRETVAGIERHWDTPWAESVLKESGLNVR